MAMTRIRVAGRMRARLLLAGLLLAGPLLASLAGAAPASAQTAAAREAVDLIEDRPGPLGWMVRLTGETLGWAGGVAGSALDYVTPPSTQSILDAAREGRGPDLFRLLGLAGYKLKEMENDVSLIPGLAFKFAMARELSEADIDYLDEQLELARIAHPGLFGRLQRAVVSTVVSINAGGHMAVSELDLTILPLPHVQFTVSPSETALGEEASTLLRAMQRIDRRVRDLAVGETRYAPRPPDPSAPPAR